MAIAEVAIELAYNSSRIVIELGSSGSKSLVGGFSRYSNSGGGKTFRNRGTIFKASVRATIELTLPFSTARCCTIY